MAEGDRERWDERYRRGSHSSAAPPAWLDALDTWLPQSGRSLDVAAGTGRYALWAAARGLEATALDVSPEGLTRCRAAARAAGLRVETLALDLEREPLPVGPFALISLSHYLQRDLFGALSERLAAGGVLSVELPTVQNLERHAQPSARFLITAAELPSLLAPLQLVYLRQGWIGDRALVRALGRRV